MKKTAVTTIFVLFIVAVVTIQVVMKIELNQNCTGYLKRAADANTVETATVELSKAIEYLESNGLTTGYTSIIYKTPDEDIAFFYNNIKSSYTELTKVNDSASQLERSNILMKLRETLLDSGEKGDKLTCPDGLSRYPHNLLFMIFNIVAGLAALIIVLLWIKDADEL